MSTYAGNRKMGMINGTKENASFANPMAIAADKKGNLYIADSHNNMIRKIDAAGNVTTLAGSGVAGSQDGPGTGASFFYPMGIAVDDSGNIIVCDTHNNRVRKITADGIVSTVAGRRDTATHSSAGSDIKFDNPVGVAVDHRGNLYIADMMNDVIKKISYDQKITNFAGIVSDAGSENGKASSSSFYLPWGIAVDSANNIYVSDSYNNMIRKIDPDGNVTTLAGHLQKGSSDGQDTAASFFHPAGIALDEKGNLYVADMGNNKIRKISPDRMVTTVAGNGLRGNHDDRDTLASFNKPYSVTISNGCIYVADYQNNLIRKISF